MWQDANFRRKVSFKAKSFLQNVILSGFCVATITAKVGRFFGNLLSKDQPSLKK